MLEKLIAKLLVSRLTRFWCKKIDVVQSRDQDIILYYLYHQSYGRSIKDSLV